MTFPAVVDQMLDAFASDILAPGEVKLFQIR
jgi:hypothetical protein